VVRFKVVQITIHLFGQSQSKVELIQGNCTHCCVFIASILSYRSYWFATPAVSNVPDLRLPTVSHRFRLYLPLFPKRLPVSDSLDVLLYSLTALNVLHIKGASLLIAQSSRFSSIHTYLCRLCCSSESSKGFPAIRWF